MEEEAPKLGLRVFLGISGAALLVALGLLFYLRSRHPFFRIPLWRVVLMFLYGALAAPVAVLITYLVLIPDKADTSTPLGAFLFIGPAEEAAKFLGPLLLVGLVRRWREEPFEWMMAGAAAGTGFAMTENILYAVTSPEAFQVLALRSLAPMHLLWSGWLGYRIGRRRAGAGGLVRSTVAGFFIASFLHGLWDALCFAGLVGVLFLLFGGQLVAFGWHIRKMTWLCANRSPRRPDPVLEAQSAARTPSPGFRCGTCGVPYESVSLRGAVILACPGCPAAAAGRGDLFRFVNEYSGSRGWFTPDAWYRYYWREPEPEGSLPCPGCGARLRARRFLHEEGPRVGFCDDCALSVGDRGDLFGLVERFRSRLENGFLHG